MPALRGRVHATQNPSPSYDRGPAIIDIAVQGSRPRHPARVRPCAGKVYLDRMRSMESLTFVEEWMK